MWKYHLQRIFAKNALTTNNDGNDKDVNYNYNVANGFANDAGGEYNTNRVYCTYKKDWIVEYGHADHVENKSNN